MDDLVINGFCVIRPNGKPILLGTFAEDEMTARRRFDFRNYSTMIWDDCVKAGYKIGVVTVSISEKKT